MSSLRRIEMNSYKSIVNSNPYFLSGSIALDNTNNNTYDSINDNNNNNNNGNFGTWNNVSMQLFKFNNNNNNIKSRTYMNMFKAESPIVSSNVTIESIPMNSYIMFPMI